jgi:integrase
VDFDAGVIRVRRSLKRVEGKLVLADLKTVTSRRTVGMPADVIAALKVHRQAQLKARMKSTDWQEHGLVLCSRAGTPRKRMATDKRFKELCELAGIGRDWQLRETRHTAVSVLSDHGVPVEHIADLVGHANSRITAQVYRHQLRDMTQDSAAIVWNSISQAKEETG